MSLCSFTPFHLTDYVKFILYLLGKAEYFRPTKSLCLNGLQEKNLLHYQKISLNVGHTHFDSASEYLNTVSILVVFSRYQKDQFLLSLL